MPKGRVWNTMKSRATLLFSTANTLWYYGGNLSDRNVISEKDF